MPTSIYSKNQEKLCAMLRLERKKAVLTQAQLARKLGKPQSYVSNYETGERRLDVVEFMDVAKAIGFDPKAMLRELEG